MSRSRFWIRTGEFGEEGLADRTTWPNPRGGFIAWKNPVGGWNQPPAPDWYRLPDGSQRAFCSKDRRGDRDVSEGEAAMILFESKQKRSPFKK